MMNNKRRCRGEPGPALRLSLIYSRSRPPVVRGRAGGVFCSAGGCKAGDSAGGETRVCPEVSPPAPGRAVPGVGGGGGGARRLGAGTGQLGLRRLPGAQWAAEGREGGKEGGEERRGGRGLHRPSLPAPPPAPAAAGGGAAPAGPKRCGSGRPGGLASPRGRCAAGRRRIRASAF